VLDPAVMPAVDAPDPGGIAFAELEILLAGLVETPQCLGVELTVFDPDYDPDGDYAAEIVDAVVAGLAPVGATAAPVHPSVRTDENEPPAAPTPPPPAVPAVAVLVEPPPPDDDAAADRASGRPRRPVAAVVADEDEATPAARPGPPRRSMDEALGGAGPRPGGRRRAAEGEAAARPGGLRRAAAGDEGEAAPRPGGLRRAAAGDEGEAAPRPGGLRRTPPVDAVGDDLTPGSVRPDDAAPPRRSMDDALDDLAGGRLRRSAADGAPRRSMDDALGDITGGRPRGNRPGAAGPGGGGDETAAPGRLRRVTEEPDDAATQNGAAHPRNA
jgi:arginase